MLSWKCPSCDYAFVTYPDIDGQFSLDALRPSCPHCNVKSNATQGDPDVQRFDASEPDAKPAA
jgi:hypothetical protein